jgi:hypothetical protein
MISKRNKGHFLWKPMEQVENFVKLNISSNLKGQLQRLKK